jgi:fumarylacetoacetase
MTVEVDITHDLRLKSWVPSAEAHLDFPVQNLPVAIFCPKDGLPRGGVAIGDFILDLAAASLCLEGEAKRIAEHGATSTLNALFALGHSAMQTLRRGLSQLLTDASQRDKVAKSLFRAQDCTLLLPFAIGDYTDFYTGIHHAENVGRLLRPDNPLLPNYKHVPIGYHGRASSIRLSGTGVRRPNGQTKTIDADRPSFGPCRRLDYELEMAIWIGSGNRLGEPVSIENAGSLIGGLSLLNDWSARDIQAWEYQPLGPFLAKNFHSTISPWVVTTEALAPFRTAQPARPEGDPAPLPYLMDAADQAAGAFDVRMEVYLQTAAMREAGLPDHKLSSGSMTAMYWTPAQLVTHHTSNGCNLVPGDLLGTGTLSGRDERSFGSLMEISRGGSRPLLLDNGETRTFLEDGDELVMKAYCERHGYARIGFGECRGRIQPAPASQTD